MSGRGSTARTSSRTSTAPSKPLHTKPDSCPAAREAIHAPAWLLPGLMALTTDLSPAHGTFLLDQFISLCTCRGGMRPSRTFGNLWCWAQETRWLRAPHMGLCAGAADTHTATGTRPLQRGDPTQSWHLSGDPGRAEAHRPCAALGPRSGSPTSRSLTCGKVAQFQPTAGRRQHCRLRDGGTALVSNLRHMGATHSGGYLVPGPEGRGCA